MVSFPPVAATLLIVLLALPGLRASPADVAQLALADLDGGPQDLRQYRGRVVVLNFWATWCAPCLEEMPLLVEAQERYADHGVVVVGASADDETTADRIQPFVERLGITFPVWAGATTADMTRLGLGTALPATAVIDVDGEIAFRILGVVDENLLAERLDHLLGDKQGPGPEPLVDNLSDAEAGHEGHDHAEDEEHAHGGVGMEGASLVPS